MKDRVTKEMVEQYEQIRSEGKFNMVTESRQVAKLMGISLDLYFAIIRNYNELMDKFQVTRL